MSLYCPPALLIGNLAGTPTENDERSAGAEDGRRFEQPLQKTHHLASAAETKEAGREKHFRCIALRSFRSGEYFRRGAVHRAQVSVAAVWLGREEDPEPGRANRRFRSRPVGGARTRLSAPAPPPGPAPVRSQSRGRLAGSGPGLMGNLECEAALPGRPAGSAIRRVSGPRRDLTPVRGNRALGLPPHSRRKLGAGRFSPRGPCACRGSEPENPGK